MAKQTKQKKGVSVRKSSEILALYQKAGVSRKTFCSTFKQYSSAVSYRHAIKPIGQKAPFPTKKGTILDCRQNNKGHPKILSIQFLCAILTAISKLCKSCGSFKSPRVEPEARVEVKVSDRTVRRILNEAGYYYYFQYREKGLHIKQDLKGRVKFCRKVTIRKLD